MAVQYHYDVDLSAHNTLRLACRSRMFVSITDSTDYLPVLEAAKQQQLPIMLLSGGSNVLLPPYIHACVIQPAHAEINILEETADSVVLKVGAGHDWHHFVLWSLAQQYYGLENLALIPGYVGAAPVQNIGAYGVEVAQCIDTVYCIDLEQLQHCDLPAAVCQFGYRDSIFKQQPQRYLIVAVSFRLSKHAQVTTHYGALAHELQPSPTPKMVAEAVIRIRQSKLPDPAQLANVGSFFKNPVVTRAQHATLAASFPQLPAYDYGDAHKKLAAGWLIEQAGWKGKQLGQVGMYARQALVLVNYQPATLSDVVSTYQQVQYDVWQQFRVRLEPEPVLYNDHGAIIAAPCHPHLL